MVRFRQPATLSAIRLAVACLSILVLTWGVFAYPRPSAAPGRWELSFESGPLRLYLDEATGDSYWYFTYKVTNQTGRDQIWAPTLVMYTDGGEILKSGRGVSTRVNDDIIDLLQNEFLLSQNSIIGELRQGADYAKEGLAVWPARNLSVTEASLFIAGVSGETAVVANPVTGEEIILRKTIQRDYLVRGDAVARGSSPLELVNERWILR